MMIAAPAPTMIGASEFTTTETEATPRTRIAMTEATDPGVGVAVAGARASLVPANAPTDLAPLQLALPHRLALHNRDAIVAVARAGRPTEAASPTEDSPRPEARLIADRLPLVAIVARPSKLNHSPNPKVDADAANVAASAARLAIDRPATCNTPPCRPGMSWVNWSR